MRGGKTFRRAVAASIGVHVLIAFAIAAFLRTSSDPPPPGLLDTRAAVQLGFFPDDSAYQSRDREGAVVEVPLPDDRGSVVEQIPVPLPDGRSSVSEAVSPPLPDGRGSVTPTAATVPSAWAVGGTAVHGPLAADQAIVYLLDASGSMGEWGKFDAARRALVATLRLQPPNVRYQVVVYAGTATVLLRSHGRMPARHAGESRPDHCGTGSTACPGRPQQPRRRDAHGLDAASGTGALLYGWGRSSGASPSQRPQASRSARHGLPGPRQWRPRRSPTRSEIAGIIR